MQELGLSSFDNMLLTRVAQNAKESAQYFVDQCRERMTFEGDSSQVRSVYRRAMSRLVLR